MAKPTFTITFTVDEMEVMAKAMIEYTDSPLLTIPEAHAADSLLDKFIAETEKVKGVPFVL